MIWSLDPAISDQHSWRLSKSGSYSSKSAYEAFFIGTIRFAPWKRIWKSWAPLKCKFFIWLVLNNRCWTTDRLAKVACLIPLFVIRSGRLSNMF